MSTELLSPPGPAPEPAQAPKKRAPRASKTAQPTVITVELQQELEQRRAGYAELLRTVQNTPCEDEGQMAWHDGIIRTAKAHAEQIEAQRKEIDEPLKLAQAAVKRMFGPALDFLKSVQAASKLKIEARLSAQAANRADALRQMADANGRVDASTLATATGAEMLAVPEGSHLRETWTFEVVDATQLPAEFWTPDSAKLAAVANSQKEAASIPGVRFFARSTLVTRK